LTDTIGPEPLRRSVRASTVSSIARSCAGPFNLSSSFDQRCRLGTLRTAMACSSAQQFDSDEQAIVMIGPACEA